MAVRSSQTSRQRLFTLPVVALVALSFALGMSEFIVVGILPEIGAGLHASLTVVGSLVSVFAVVYAPSTPIGASISARFERFHAIMALTGMFLLGNVVCAIAPDYPVFLAGRVIIALVSGTIVALSLTFAPDVASEGNGTRFVAWVFSGFSIASVFGVPIGTAIAHGLGWRWTFWLIVMLTVVLITMMTVSLPRGHHGVRVRFAAQFRLFGDRQIVLGVAAMVCAIASMYVFYTYLTPTLRGELRIPEAYMSGALAVFGTGGLAGNLLSGRLGASGRGAEPMIRMKPLFILDMLLLALLTVAVGNAVFGALVLIALSVLMYLPNTPAQMLYMGAAMRRHPGSVNLASSLQSMSSNIGIALGSAVGGLIVGTAGLRWLGLGGAVFAMLAALFTMRLKMEE